MDLPDYGQAIGEELYRSCVEGWPYQMPYRSVEIVTPDHAVASIMIGMNNREELAYTETHNGWPPSLKTDPHDRNSLSDLFTREFHDAAVEGMERVVCDYVTPSTITAWQMCWLSKFLYGYPIWSEKTAQRLMDWLEALTKNQQPSETAQIETWKHLSRAIFDVLANPFFSQQKDNTGDMWAIYSKLIIDENLTPAQRSLRDRLGAEAAHTFDASPHLRSACLKPFNYCASDEAIRAQSDNVHAFFQEWIADSLARSGRSPEDTLAQGRKIWGRIVPGGPLVPALT